MQKSWQPIFIGGSVGRKQAIVDSLCRVQIGRTVLAVSVNWRTSLYPGLCHSYQILLE